MAANSRKLSKLAQIFVVQRLAMFDRPKMVQDALKEVHGVEVALPAIVYYDISNPDLPKKWKELFETTRQRFIEDTNSIPIANKAFRLRELDRLYHIKKGGKVENPVDQRATLEQAAKEAGDAFTNRREIALNVSDLTDEELEAVAGSKG